MKTRLTALAFILIALAGVFITVNASANKEYEIVLRVTVNNSDSFEFELVRADEKIITNEPHFWHIADSGEELKGILKISFGGEYWQCESEMYLVPTKFYVSSEQRAFLHQWGVGSMIVLNYHKATVDEDVLMGLRECPEGGLIRLEGLIEELRINKTVSIQPPA